MLHSIHESDLSVLAMRYAVTKFKSLSVCLQELKPFIQNGQHLLTGKPFARFDGLRSRELLGNWLCCVAINSITQPDRLTFTSDPTGGDGVIVDTITGDTWPVEHVMIPAAEQETAPDIQALISAAITTKQRKGEAAYATGKTLIVFLNSGGGEWYPNRVARALPTPLLFEAVWVWGFQSNDGGCYVYQVTRLDMKNGNAPAWRVRIDTKFETWTVEVVQ